MELDVSTLGTTLGIWAHPDDEAYLMGGVMALGVAYGQRVACVTATLGDAGQTADQERWPRERLRSVRRAELATSLQVLTVTDHEHLDLRDGHLAETDPTRPIMALRDHVDRVRPDTVITFGPDGMTGHPDHQAISRWTSRACDMAAVHPRLLWATKTPDWIDAFPEVNDEVFPPDLPPSTPTDSAWTVVLDDELLERKVRALEAHASQTTGLIQALGRQRYAEWVRHESFREADTTP